MWKRRSDLLAPLTALCSSAIKWRWADVEQKTLTELRQPSQKMYYYRTPILVSPLIYILMPVITTRLGHFSERKTRGFL